MLDLFPVGNGKRKVNSTVNLMMLYGDEGNYEHGQSVSLRKFNMGSIK